MRKLHFSPCINSCNQTKIAIKMSQVHLNHGDSPTFSSAHNSSDSRHWRAIRDMVVVCKLRMIVVAFLQPLVRDDELVKFYAVLETTLTALRRGVSRSLQLKFSQEMPEVVFTGDLIVAKGDGTLEVALVDGATGDVVRYGAGSSGKIEIVPVEGNFVPGENWMSEDFDSKIVVGEDGRNSLLSKNPYLKMEEGTAPVCGIKFKNTRKGMKKSKLRLGARFVHQPDNGIRIREAVSEPFIVKDWRLKPKKKFPPSPTDEVWRLINIGKGGAFHKRLVEEKILTVKDFLIEFLNNPERLRRDILGMSSNARWKATSDHALTCPPSPCRHLSAPTNDLAAAPSTAFAGNSELQHDNNNCGLLLSQTSSSAHIIPSHAVASLKALSRRQSDTDGFSKRCFSFDDIGAMCVQQNGPSNSEDCSDWIAEYRRYEHEFDIDIDEASAGVTTNSLGVAAATPKFSKWAKMCSLVRWFSLKKNKAIAPKTLLHVAKKQRLC